MSIPPTVWDCFPSESDSLEALTKAREDWEARASQPWPQDQTPHRACAEVACTNGDHIYPAHAGEVATRVEKLKQEVFEFQRSEGRHGQLARKTRTMTTEELLQRLKQLEQSNE